MRLPGPAVIEEKDPLMMHFLHGCCLEGSNLPCFFLCMFNDVVQKHCQSP